MTTVHGGYWLGLGGDNSEDGFGRGPLVARVVTGPQTWRWHFVDPVKLLQLVNGLPSPDREKLLSDLA